MQLNRSSGIVRWYLFVNFARSEEAKQKELAEATNLCTFVQRLAFWTIIWALIGVILLAVMPCGWMITAFMIAGGVTIGWIPVGWHASLKDNRPAQILFPAMAFQWERKLGICIGTRVVFPNHVWGTALVVLGVWALAR